jgi:hypothetical protein
MLPAPAPATGRAAAATVVRIPGELVLPLIYLQQINSIFFGIIFSFFLGRTIEYCPVLLFLNILSIIILSNMPAITSRSAFKIFKCLLDCGIKK